MTSTAPSLPDPDILQTPHPSHLQPFLHDLVTTFAAPTQVLSSRDGDIVSSTETPSAQGILHADVRVVGDLRVTVSGRPGEHIATEMGSTSARFSSLLRHLGTDAPRAADPQLRLDRHRSVSPGLVAEELSITSVRDTDIDLVVQVSLVSDKSSVSTIKSGGSSHPVTLTRGSEGRPQVSWESGDVSVQLDTPGAILTLTADRAGVTAAWPVSVTARSGVTVGWTMVLDDRAGVVRAARGPGLNIVSITAAASAPSRASQVDYRLGASQVDYRLRPWLTRSISDLNSLRMTAVDSPDDPFFAAGAPWYLTLFGRDSMWTARLLLPVDVTHAFGTLRTLARLMGTKTDPDSAEEPGKIMHELRRSEVTFDSMALPPLYYGTIDATPLWIILLHDAWRAGLDESSVRLLLPALQSALTWLVSCGDADGDGFLEYLDVSGHGLSNQGWKDSSDSVRFADGRIASGAVALCEVQGYAYEAAHDGAALLDAFGLPGAQPYRDWAETLAVRFRTSFWCGEGDDRYPALALDGSKERVDSVTSNMGHLIGTGILTADEELLVARRLAAPDMDSGLGLRTMSARAGGYSPLSYHCGSVWAHDTAIVIAGMHKAGLLDHAHGLVEGLLQASVAFDGRLPELWSGEGKPVPYPAACRPQAWSAAAAVTVAEVLQAAQSR